MRRADVCHVERELAQVQSARRRERFQRVELRSATIVLRDKNLVEGGPKEDFLARIYQSECNVAGLCG